MPADVSKTLWDIAQSLHAYLNIDDLILAINQRVKQALQAQGVSVILLDDPSDELVFCWAQSDPLAVSSRLKKIRIPRNQGIAGSVLKSGRAEIVDSVDIDPRHYKTIDTEVGFETTCMLVAPLVKKRKAIGVIEVLNKKQGRFDQTDLTFVTTLAPIIALAIDNARMYGELDGKFRRLEADHREKDRLIRQVREQNDQLRRQVQGSFRFDGIIGSSAGMMHVMQLCEHVIDVDITVMIGGETGTGKELVARCIHYNSERKNKPFVSQNCGGMPDSLLTSELFGHRKGAFTGAVTDKKGLFEIADGGTLFLDEVGEMSPAMQTALLRVLQDGEIRPLGSNRTIQVDTRLVSATHRDLEKDVAEGRFREDLLYRLNVFSIHLPPLRERGGDIPALVNHFLDKFNQRMKTRVQSITPQAMMLLEQYPFPGNVRELENEIERALALAQHSRQIEPQHLSEKITNTTDPSSGPIKAKGTLKEMITDLEKTVLANLLAKHDGNRTRVAEELGLSRYGLIKKIQRYGLT